METKYNVFKILSFAVLLSLFTLGAFAINCTISPSVLSFNLSTNSSYQGSFVVKNLGNDTINLTLNNGNSTFKLGSLGVVFNEKQFNLTNNTNKTISFLVNSTNISAGNYSKNLSIFIKNNSVNLTKQLLFKIEVLPLNKSSSINSSNSSSNSSSIHGGYSFILDTNNVSLSGNIGDTIYKSVLITNTGNKTLHNFRIGFNNLYSINSNDEIYDYRFDLTSSDGFDLAPGQSRIVRFKVYLPSGISPSTYTGMISFKFNEVSKDYPISVNVVGGSYNVYIERYGDNVVNGMLTVYGNAGDLITNGNEFRVMNDGNFYVTGIYFKVTDLSEEVSGKTLSSNIITFIPSNIDLGQGNYEDVEARVSIPENTSSGTYYGQINMYNKNGEKLGTTTLKLVVIGDIYINGNVKFSEKNISPGDTLIVSMNISNSGTMMYRNVKVDGTINNIDNNNDELSDSTNTFALNVGETVEKRLYFNIPRDATSGSKTLEIEITYGNSNEVYDLETFNVVRPLSDVEIRNSFVRPTVVSCDRNVYTYVSAINYGSLTQNVRMISYINGTAIYKETGLISVNPDESFEKSLTLDLSSLRPGVYNLVTEILYGSKSDKRVTLVSVENCSSNNVVVHTYKDNTTENVINSQNNSINKNNTTTLSVYLTEKVDFLGTPIQRLTLFLGIATFVILLISLFLKIMYL